MIGWIYNLWQLLKVCLGFIPAVIMGLTALLLVCVFTVEHLYLRDLEIPYLLYSGEIEDVKSLINVLLQSMVTMTTLVITITMVVLSLAATQLGPRLIKNFAGNTITHTYVGLFFGAVVSCLILVGIIHHAALSTPVPGLTISIVIGFCFINFCLLLGFVNHVANSCIADNVILRVYKELLNAVDHLAIKKEEAVSTGKAPAPFPKDFDKKSRSWPGGKSGFIQHINHTELLYIAERYDLYIHLRYRAGDYITAGQPFIDILAPKKTDDSFIKSIKNQIFIGNNRTATQDVEYSVRHIVEIGLRALSPGINDHATAKIALNYLTAAIDYLATKTLPDSCYIDSNNKCRLIVQPQGMAQMIPLSFGPILEAGQGKSDIIAHGLEKIETLMAVTNDKDSQKALQDQLDILKDYIARNYAHIPALQKELKSRYKALA